MFITEKWVEPDFGASFSTYQSKKVLEHTCVEFDLENDKAEYFIEKSLFALNAIGDAVEAGLDARAE